MSTFEEDLAYLRAELAQAQQLGATSTRVRVTELQGLLDRLRMLSQLPKQPVDVLGFCRPGEVRGFKKGSIPTIRIRRKPSEWHTESVFYDRPPVYHKESIQ